VGKIRNFRPPHVWTKTFVFLLTLDRESTDRCFLYDCYGNPNNGETLSHPVDGPAVGGEDMETRCCHNARRSTPESRNVDERNSLVGVPYAVGRSGARPEHGCGIGAYAALGGNATHLMAGTSAPRGLGDPANRA
jgi:hypothetical protein